MFVTKKLIFLNSLHVFFYFFQIMYDLFLKPINLLHVMIINELDIQFKVLRIKTIRRGNLDRCVRGVEILSCKSVCRLYILLFISHY